MNPPFYNPTWGRTEEELGNWFSNYQPYPRSPESDMEQWNNYYRVPDYVFPEIYDRIQNPISPGAIPPLWEIPEAGRYSRMWDVPLVWQSPGFELDQNRMTTPWYMLPDNIDNWVTGRQINPVPYIPNMHNPDMSNYGIFEWGV